MIADIEFTDVDFEEGGDFYNGGQGFAPIGTDENTAFAGTFDGKGHTISGIYATCNAEPMADFIDVFMLGDGEETTDLLISLVKKHKELGSSKIDFLRDVATHKGFYVPAFYDVEYNEDGTIQTIEGIDE